MDVAEGSTDHGNTMHPDGCLSHRPVHSDWLQVSIPHHIYKETEKTITLIPMHYYEQVEWRKFRIHLGKSTPPPP